MCETHEAQTAAGAPSLQTLINNPASPALTLWGRAGGLHRNLLKIF